MWSLPENPPHAKMYSPICWPSPNIPPRWMRVLGFHLISKSKPLISSNSNVDGVVAFNGWWSQGEPTLTLKPHSTTSKC